MVNNIMIKNDSFIQSIHNDIQCISLVDANRPNDRCWFTSKQIQDWAGMDRKTLDRRLEKLISVGCIINNTETIDNTGKKVIVKFDNHVYEQNFTDIMSITFQRLSLLMLLILGLRNNSDSQHKCFVICFKL